MYLTSKTSFFSFFLLSMVHVIGLLEKVENLADMTKRVNSSKPYSNKVSIPTGCLHLKAL